jgi:hypothetical protein
VGLRTFNSRSSHSFPGNDVVHKSRSKPLIDARSLFEDLPRGFLPRHPLNRKELIGPTEHRRMLPADHVLPSDRQCRHARQSIALRHLFRRPRGRIHTKRRYAAVNLATSTTCFPIHAVMLKVSTWLFASPSRFRRRRRKGEVFLASDGRQSVATSCRNQCSNRAPSHTHPLTTTQSVGERP